MTAEEIIRHLNELYLAYKEATHNAKPYAFSKTRTTYQEYLNQIRDEFEIIPLDQLEKFELLIGFSTSLKKSLEDRNKAVLAQEYEAAAQLHDKAKLLVVRALSEHGFNANLHYFLKEGKIYFKPW